MLDIGFWEFALIGIVALVVVGPERFPGMARTAGQLIGRAKRAMRELRYELERDLEVEETDGVNDAFLDESIDIEVLNQAKDKSDD
ncbi:MAG TPA: twin-arginine translocase subunit TatB [Gammaproteobacteria bacterium]|nr:twin-arginine translocase subunit TatB [Gammaproteobacteria bacterium]|tara:strand:+ start:2287 stop:2544 length:258 start_codon:yes stop_codon:yes gene_type:complete